MPFLTGENKAAPHQTLYWRWMSQAAIQEFPYKLIALGDRERLLFDITTPEGENIERNLIAQEARHRRAARSEAQSMVRHAPTARHAAAACDRHHEAVRRARHQRQGRTRRSSKSKPAPKAPSRAGSAATARSRSKTAHSSSRPMPKPPRTPARSSPTAALDMAGPVTATLRLRAKQGGKSTLTWRTKQQPDFIPENTAAFDWPAVRRLAGSEGRPSRPGPPHPPPHHPRQRQRRPRNPIHRTPRQGRQSADVAVQQRKLNPIMKLVLTLLATLLLVPLAAVHAADARPAALAKDYGPAANLLQNPSFQKKAGDGVEGWMSRAWAGKEATRWSVAAPGRTGERCVSIASDRGGDAAWTAIVSVQPGAWYRLSGWIKTREVRGAAGALLHIQNMQGLDVRGVGDTGLDCALRQCSRRMRRPTLK